MFEIFLQRGYFYDFELGSIKIYSLLDTSAKGVDEAWNKFLHILTNIEMKVKQKETTAIPYSSFTSLSEIEYKIDYCKEEIIGIQIYNLPYKSKDIVLYRFYFADKESVGTTKRYFCNVNDATDYFKKDIEDRIISNRRKEFKKFFIFAMIGILITIFTILISNNLYFLFGWIIAMVVFSIKDFSYKHFLKSSTNNRYKNIPEESIDRDEELSYLDNHLKVLTIFY